MSRQIYSTGAFIVIMIPPAISGNQAYRKEVFGVLRQFIKNATQFLTKPLKTFFENNFLLARWILKKTLAAHPHTNRTSYSSSNLFSAPPISLDTLFKIRNVCTVNSLKKICSRWNITMPLHTPTFKEEIYAH